MKRLVVGAVSIIALMAVVGAGYALVKADVDGQNVAASSSLRKSPVSKCINLGNALDAPNEGDWTYSIEDDHLRAIGEAGFETVRVPVRWSAHAMENPPYTIDEAFFQRVEHVVNEARRADLTVILDVHHYEKIMQDPEAHYDRLNAMWKQIARRFRGYGEDVVYEVLNEANAELTNEKLMGLNARIVSTIRNSVGADPWIILGGEQWGNLSGIRDVVFPEDPRTIATFHDYGPFEFTHQGAEFTVDYYPVGTKWGSAKDKRDADELFEEAKKLGLYHNKPLFMGEFGVIKGVPDDQRAEYLEYYRRSAEENGIGWCLWDFGAAFGIYDVESKAWSSSALDALLVE